MTISQAMIDRTTRFEGNVPYMYLDTRGYVTVGVGFMLDSATAAATYPFVRRVDQQLATEEERKAAWSAVSDAERGYPASYYESLTTLVLPSVDTILRQKLTAFEADLKSIFGDYDTFPAPAQEALVDLIYNLGKAGLQTFTKLLAAIRAREWALAASESHRASPVPEARNAETHALFERAAQLAPTLNGTWSAWASYDGETYEFTVTITKIGSNAYQGRASGVIDGDAFDVPLQSLAFVPPSRVSFTVEDFGSFQGTASADFQTIQGTIEEDGEVVGTLVMRRA